MSAQHTQEQLTATDMTNEDGRVYLTIKGKKYALGMVFNLQMRGNTLNDARRLAACWNACEGLHTESLECGKPLADQLVEALNQRDELRVENKQLKATQYGSGKLQALRDQRDNMLAALNAAKRLFDEALPKFNWGASALDANAIRLLNEVPRLVQDAIAKTTRDAA